MAKSAIKIRILQTLLESPKRTGEIAIELGYKNKKTGYGDYHNVTPGCNKLVKEKLIHEIEPLVKTTGNPGTTYDIVYEIPRLRDLLINYDTLISDMMKNDIIISLLVDNDKFEPYIGNLGELLRLSESFFRNYLTNDLFYERFKWSWFNINTEGSEARNPLDPSINIINLTFQYVLFDMFKHCVIEDNLKGIYIPAAFQYIQKERCRYSLDRVDGVHKGIEYSNDNADPEIINKKIVFV